MRAGDYIEVKATFMASNLVSYYQILSTPRSTTSSTPIREAVVCEEAVGGKEVCKGDF